MTAAPAHLLNRPGQRGLDRGGGGVDVMAVEAQAGFQAEGVAGAQAGGLHFGLGQQGTGQGHGLVLVDRDLEAVLAGVARARDEAVGTGQLEAAAGHEGELADAGVQAAERRHGLGALQGQQRALGHGNDLAEAADAGLQVGGVGVLATGVHHHEQVAEAGAVGGLRAGDHQVVLQAAGVIGEQGVALLAGRQVDDVHRHQGFQGGGGIFAHQAQLAHVGDVEQGGGLAALAVLGHQAGRVLHRHGVAGERHHAGAQLKVQCVQGRVEQGGLGRGHRRSFEGSSVNHTGLEMPPLSALPERLTVPWMTHTACPFGGRTRGPPLSSEERPACDGEPLVSPFA
jgi:hypothetical protein